MAKPKPLTESEKIFIRLHHKTMPVLKMAEALNRGFVTIQKWMKEEGLEPYRTPRGVTIASDHPFKKKNGQLRVMFMARRLSNKHPSKS